ncbi:general transcription factor 3C polypeptide 5-like [Tropilaelaps mercedesae]|uniref:General transcription factor 3C polypeptide 5-like n=1 Tax=Tropilaelaps mercedesae TaxID=418985 RepID=A0A1V9XCM2_9ACAR|nr:general transcription factor 3C polypeptide 5-like [Tropilaelaps mercedesae]
MEPGGSGSVNREADSRLPIQALPILVLIKHPCLIRDGSEKRAIAMLGGVGQVEHTFNVGNMRMQLNFRTDGDSCSKGIFGTHRDVIGIWAVVRRYRNRRTGQINYRSEPQGVVRHVYEFDGMADFQYLPALFANQLHKSSKQSSTHSDKQTNASGSEDAVAQQRATEREETDKTRMHFSTNEIGTDIRGELVEIDVANVEFDSFVKSNSGRLFIVPQVFTRMDLPYSGVYRHVTETRLRRRDEAGLPVLRKQRANYATIVRLLAPPFGDPVPQMALPEALELFMLVDESLRRRVAEAFERRPVWTKSALSHELDLDRLHLKTAIVGLAYCVSQGPFRLCWVRYGFDPRVHPSSKPYQTLDCRVKASAGFQSGRSSASSRGTTSGAIGSGSSWNAPAVRGGHVVPVQIAASGHRHKRNRRDDCEAREVRERNTRMLRCRYMPGLLPHSKQLLYHLCDIGLDCVQELIHRNDGLEVWTDQDGWCLPDTIKHIRDYLAADMKRTAERQRAEQDREEGDEGSSSLKNLQKGTYSAERACYDGNELQEDLEEEDDDDDDMEGLPEES